MSNLGGEALKMKVFPDLMDDIPNVLAQRYASASMREIWSPRGKIRMERAFWIAVLKAQQAHGLEVPTGAVTAYEGAVDNIDVADILRRERETRHDVKARIESFNALAGYEEIHKGMTSRDLTENVEQLQVYRSLELVRQKAVAVLGRLVRRSTEWKDLMIAGRTHNVPAQATTLGKRMAMFAEEFLLGLEALERLMESYPIRGLKGAVGTQLDPIRLLGGDPRVAAALEEEVLQHLGLPRTLAAVGQVYPRSLDFQVVSALYTLVSGPSGLARTLRLMAGQELASEGFVPGQVGSSAMPHKMNSRSCERINGLQVVLRGYVAMAEGLAGDQWNEGDVSCSVVRRVMLPDAFFAVDGLFETLLTVLDQMEIYPSMIEAENRRTLPFLLTTAVLMEAVKQGVGRETAHSAIRRHALETVRGLRSGELQDNDLLERLAEDPELRLSRERLEELLADEAAHTGAAGLQVDALAAKARPWLERFPEAGSYKPGSIL